MITRRHYSPKVTIGKTFKEGQWKLQSLHVHIIIAIKPPQQAHSYNSQLQLAISKLQPAPVPATRKLIPSTLSTAASSNSFQHSLFNLPNKIPDLDSAPHCQKLTPLDAVGKRAWLGIGGQTCTKAACYARVVEPGVPSPEPVSEPSPEVERRQGWIGIGGGSCGNKPRCYNRLTQNDEVEAVEEVDLTEKGLTRRAWLGIGGQTCTKAACYARVVEPGVPSPEPVSEPSPEVERRQGWIGIGGGSCGNKPRCYNRLTKDGKVEAVQEVETDEITARTAEEA
ncbi:hypothetical protein B0H67DRAFT_550033 [Lasiosphaeris hirsuta]|uniref:Uncharacterized protein n=1 Tax=Lasiosphaeris hirsuta TaxID=260670 RepID=A0AA40AY76_9PEZI|nr:hypothetical protein B0H67DRAFT_550033 [Lasiosphaeris hirsuta]